jgi:hypothetical protein
MQAGAMEESDDEDAFVDALRGEQPAPHVSPSARSIPQDDQVAAAVEGVNSDVQKYLQGDSRHCMRWVAEIDRFRELFVNPDLRAWGRIAGNPDGHLCLRAKWLTWMACTSKLLQTVDNKHLNRHLDYQYAGPTVNFVDVQTTPQIGRRLQMLSHFAECINNFGEFPIECVVPTPETELLFGQGRSGKLVRGMRMKSSTQGASREIELTSSLRSAEKWLKNFNRGKKQPDLLCHVSTIRYVLYVY